jgi:hypothetical protein
MTRLALCSILWKNRQTTPMANNITVFFNYLSRLQRAPVYLTQLCLLWPSYYSVIQSYCQNCSMIYPMKLFTVCSNYRQYYTVLSCLYNEAVFNLQTKVYNKHDPVKKLTLLQPLVLYNVLNLQCALQPINRYFTVLTPLNNRSGPKWGFSLTCPQKEGGWEEISAVCSFIQSSCALHGGPKYFKVVPDTKLWKYPGLKCGILLLTPKRARLHGQDLGEEGKRERGRRRRRWA